MASLPAPLRVHAGATGRACWLWGGPCPQVWPQQRNVFQSRPPFLRKPSTSAKVQSVGFLALSLFADDTKARKTIIEEYGFSPVLAALEVFAGAEEPVRISCELLESLLVQGCADDCEHLSKFVDDGGLDAIFPIMDHCLMSTAIQTTCLHILEHLAQDDQVKDAILDRDGLKFIFAAFYCGEDHPELLQAFVDLSTTLSSRENDAFPELLATVLGSASPTDEPRGFGSIAEKMAEASFDVPLLAIMKSRKKVCRDPQIQFAAFCALVNISSCESTAKTFARVGILLKLLNFYREHADGIDALFSPSAICEAVAYYAVDDVTVHHLVVYGGYEMVVSALSKYPDNEDVAKFGCLALALVAVSGADGLQVIKAQNGLKLVKKSAAAFPGNKSIQDLHVAIEALVASSSSIPQPRKDGRTKAVKRSADGGPDEPASTTVTKKRGKKAV